ncbi:MAG: hypothetical protein GY765_36355 [bacterium]|nr:hypothetical protein [bacterium]
MKKFVKIENVKKNHDLQSIRQKEMEKVMGGIAAITIYGVYPVLYQAPIYGFPVLYQAPIYGFPVDDIMAKDIMK